MFEGTASIKTREDAQRLETQLRERVERQKQLQDRAQSSITQAIDDADVVIEMLDVRDPVGCRLFELESYFLGEKQLERRQARGESIKPLVLVLNKIGLYTSVSLSFPSTHFVFVNRSRSRGDLSSLDSKILARVPLCATGQQSAWCCSY